jgi:phosphosulfolactate synthase
MNFSINSLPERHTKPRKEGLTMVMDKGLSVREAEYAIRFEPYIDLGKLGFELRL